MAFDLVFTEVCPIFDSDLTQFQLSNGPGQCWPILVTVLTHLWISIISSLTQFWISFESVFIISNTKVSFKLTKLVNNTKTLQRICLNNGKSICFQKTMYVDCWQWHSPGLSKISECIFPHITLCQSIIGVVSMNIPLLACDDVVTENNNPRSFTSFCCHMFFLCGMEVIKPFSFTILFPQNFFFNSKITWLALTLSSCGHFHLWRLIDARGRCNADYWVTSSEEMNTKAFCFF